MKGPGIKYPDIPEEVRAGARTYVRLLKAGQPIPDHVRELHNKYKGWARRSGRKPGFTGNIVRTDIPEEFRRANTEVARMKRLGKKPDAETKANYSEYQRWLKYGGKPPPKKVVKFELDKMEWPMAAALEWDRRISGGEAPGEIQQYIVDGRAKHKGLKPSKYTPCSPSDRTGGKGCRKKHGNGPKRLRYGPGIANCTKCQIGYTNVPDDVNRCGCCGATLRKQKRSKS